MAAMIPGFSLFLLQDSFFKEDNPMEALIIGIAAGVIVVISIIVRLVSGGVSSPSRPAGKSKAGPTPRKFNFFSLQRIASNYGLNKDQKKLLEYVFRNDGVSDPERVMKTPVLLDKHFKRAFKTIEKNSTSDDITQQRLHQLFSLRNYIESGGADESETSPRITNNTPAILSYEKDSFPIKVISSRSQSLITELPKNSLGTPIRLNKGSKITLSFFTKSSSGFSLDGQVNGSENTDMGPGLQINHNGRMTPLVKRKFRRRQINTQCLLFLVNLEEYGKGRKKTTKLVVDNRKFKGNIQDISIGGCSIKTSAPIQAGVRLKINVDYDDNFPISVLGQVIRSNRSSFGTIIHIKFQKVPRRSFNSISTLVFGYNE